MPRVSVIIPVHNAERYLRECMDSVLAQTLEDIEVLCVDDGSVDASLDILRTFAETDDRVEVLQQANSGAGAARNVAMRHATGDYYSFLDADDLFEPRMLERAHAKCLADAADVCVYRARLLDSDTGAVSKARSLLRAELLPDSIPFSYRDIPDHIFDFTSPAPWNKLFRRAFVAEHGLRFQEIERANDFLFTKIAMVKAARITIVDEYLVYYRIGVQSNLQSNNDETPLVFHEAHVALRDALVKAGVFADVERAFVNLVLGSCLYNLRTLRTPEAFELLYRAMRDDYFSRMGVDGRSPDYFFSEKQYAQYLKIRELSPEAYLLDEARTLRVAASTANAKLSAAQAQLRNIKGSGSYKVARAITSLPRRLKHPGPPRRRES